MRDKGLATGLSTQHATHTYTHTPRFTSVFLQCITSKNVIDEETAWQIDR